mmetsp:Transcript_5816/g.9665  ORF Transcript_5816/g.9665 Transcript_5816/m.9665 type:complete len:253 (+) Transcript_5816:341-1099(+)|eukprot:CAMPEP_0119012810 /NCGR_PEP_ID=MMETSP1176-20130426/7637_1 /TAXON_ID=265551 /ORGANISM="Synedropsis recta cf, Strain CCMP1620" /LENGTH=252 /DNA_ID=CAMNT_0006965839 /DNA_START=341 /DNA_END=1099 /DNA_ORIENTATION=+
MPKRKASTKMWTSGRSSSKSNSGSFRSKKGNNSNNSSSNINESNADKLFSEICDPDDHSIATMEGISSFCDKLGLDPLEDVRVLVLLWKMEAVAKPAQISRIEWMSACQKLQADGVDTFKTLVIPTLETGFLDNEEFKDFYKFCFQFNREGTHKTLDKELVVLLVQLVLNDTNRVSKQRLASFCQFLEACEEDYKRITLDQWTSFWDFSQELGDDEDLSAYDEATSAWPVLIDEYVEYMEEQQKKTTSSKKK